MLNLNTFLDFIHLNISSEHPDSNFSLQLQIDEFPTLANILTVKLQERVSRCFKISVPILFFREKRAKFIAWNLHRIFCWWRGKINKILHRLVFPRKTPRITGSLQRCKPWYTWFRTSAMDIFYYNVRNLSWACLYHFVAPLAKKRISVSKWALFYV